MDESTCSLDRDQKCEVCQSRVYKYKCPGCLRKTCSVKCVKKHKVDFSCSGRRCKTAFVRLSEFDDNKLLSDYYFLEDVSRCVDSTHRQRLHSDTEKHDSKRVSQKFYWLMDHAKRRSINLLLQPPGMTKHRLNSSRTVPSSNGGWSILWTVRLVFRDTDVDLTEHKVPEDINLTDLLNRFVHPRESDPILRHRLRTYVQGGGVEGLQVFLKNETSSSSSNDKLDLSKTLCDNLRDRSLVEFPTLLIEKDTHACPSHSNRDTDHSPVCSDWSDYEEGELTEMSSLELIARDYGDS